MASHKSSIIDYNDVINDYDPKKNTSRNFLNKYERVKLIGNRAEQLQRGSIPLVEFDTSKKFNAIEIAKKELEQRKMPFMIKRTLPDNTLEYWRLKDMVYI